MLPIFWATLYVRFKTCLGFSLARVSLRTKTKGLVSD